jgi:RNA polymerase sigma-70 factor (ECF subfamily)
MPRETVIPELVRRHGGRLYVLGLRLCGSPEDAEDLVQETFLNAFRKWDQFDGRSEPGTWLYAIASRVCRRLHRRRAGEPKRMASYEELPFAEPKLAVVDDQIERQIRKEGIAQVESAITTLPLAFRVPLVLKDIVGFSVAEAAKILGLKEATLKTRVHRARLRIREAIETTVPRRRLPPPAYSKQVCLDLLRAKQEALDRGVEMPGEVVCARCRAVFATMDLARDICKEIGRGALPEKLKAALLSEVSG